MRAASLLLLCSLTSPGWASPAPLLATEARHAVQALAGALQSEMQEAMAQGGPLAAVRSCNAEAIPLTARIAREQGLQIGRTALRVRNPANSPDPWERRVLERFLQRQQAGEPLKGMSFSEVVEENGQRVFRLLQAIPTQPQCLGCHGENLEPALQHAIDSLYPADQARGFRAGDLRGAFSVRRVL